jgi:hypothetical protein
MGILKKIETIVPTFKLDKTEDSFGMVVRILMLLVMIFVSLFSYGQKRIFVFGDSHVFSGIGVYLGEDIKKDHKVVYEYYGVSGAGFTNEFNGKKNELLRKIVKFKPDMIICFIGTNEMYYNKNGYKNILNVLDVFFMDFDKKKLIIVSLPYYEWKGAKNVSFGLKTFSKKNDIRYVDIFDKRYSELNLLNDKYHFSQQGYKNISGHINTLLKKMTVFNKTFH